MTQSTKELVRAFVAHGGKVVTIPMGVSGEVKYKSFFNIAHAHSRRTKELWHVRSDAASHKRISRGCNAFAPVDVFIKQGTKGMIQ